MITEPHSQEARENRVHYKQQMQGGGGYFRTIPTCIMHNNELEFGQRLLWAEIGNLADRKGYCFASNGYLGKLFGVAPVTIKRWILDMAKKGYLKVLYNDEEGQGFRHIMIMQPTEEPDCSVVVESEAQRGTEQLSVVQDDETPEESPPRVTHGRGGITGAPPPITQVPYSNSQNKNITAKYKNKERVDAGPVILAPDWMDAETVSAWKDWISYRRERRLTCTPTVIKRQLAFLQGHGKDALAILEASLTNGWQGLFELKPGGKKQTSVLSKNVGEPRFDLD